MAKNRTSPLPVAQKLLAAKRDGMKELRIHWFEDDEAAHDDELIERLYKEFSSQLAAVKGELTKKYGKPTHTGSKDHAFLPVTGVFRYAIWKVGKMYLWIAATHEDREVPIILLLGVAIFSGK